MHLHVTTESHTEYNNYWFNYNLSLLCIIKRVEYHAIDRLFVNLPSASEVSSSSILKRLEKEFFIKMKFLASHCHLQDHPSSEQLIYHYSSHLLSELKVSGNINGNNNYIIIYIYIYIS